MGKQDKIVTSMRSNPRDWRIEQVESVAAHAGLKVRKNGGSHVVIHQSGVRGAVVCPD